MPTLDAVTLDSPFEITGSSGELRSEPGTSRSFPIAPPARRPPPVPQRPRLASTPPPRPERAPLAAGDVVGARYRLEHRLGVGGMGEVWAAVHVTLHTRVAVKVLLAQARLVPELVSRFEREAMLLGRAQGPHVPLAIDYFVDETLGPVLVTELVEGPSLSSVLERRLSVEEAVELGIELATGLAQLHAASIVHRDLKPGNVILRPVGPGVRRAVILDLGVGRLLQDAQDPEGDVEPITTADVVVGTVEYMAPEQVLSCREATPAADLYALGALLFRAVAGSHAFGVGLERIELLRAKLTTEAPALSVDRDDALARGLVRFVARALEREPARRHASALEMRDELAQLLRTAHEVPTPEPRPGWLVSARLWSRTALARWSPTRGAGEREPDPPAPVRPPG